MSESHLRVSRDCTADDLAAIMPEASPQERLDFLDTHRRNGDVVTFAVVDMDDEGPVAGMIIGPAGSDRFLRRPGENAGLAADGRIQPPEHAACRQRSVSEEQAVRIARSRRVGEVEHG